MLWSRYHDRVKAASTKRISSLVNPMLRIIHPENAKQELNPRNKTNRREGHYFLQLLKGNVGVQHVEDLVALAGLRRRLILQA